MEKPVQHKIRWCGALPQWVDWLIVAISVLGILAAFALLASTGSTFVVVERAIVHFMPGPALVYLIVAVLAALFVLPPALRKPRRWTPALLLVAGVVLVVGLGLSLLFRDDYFGGSCGVYDWPSGHLHAGYPYSWLDGHICVPPGNDLGEYTRLHPEQAGWLPDFIALAVDLIFWANVGLVIASFLRLATSTRKRKAENES